MIYGKFVGDVLSTHLALRVMHFRRGPRKEMGDRLEFLSGEEEIAAKQYIAKAAEIAKNSTCFRSKCGTVIVKGNEIIGEGFNSLPLNEHPDHCFKDELPLDFKSDKTCCMHAEQRAITEALKSNLDKLNGSRLYFIRLDENGNKQRSGDPYCTICSKMALDCGVSEFILWQDKGICVYNTKEYNALSFQFKE